MMQFTVLSTQFPTKISCPALPSVLVLYSRNPDASPNLVKCAHANFTPCGSELTFLENCSAYNKTENPGSF